MPALPYRFAQVKSDNAVEKAKQAALSMPNDSNFYSLIGQVEVF